jgi:hypothetical protein
VDVFLSLHQMPPEEIILDLDATNKPLHGQQLGRFFKATTGTTAICRCTSSVESTFCAPG